MAYQPVNLGEGAASMVQAGANLARDPLSLKVADMMGTIMQEKGETNRTNVREAGATGRTMIAAGYQPKEGGGFEEAGLNDNDWKMINEKLKALSPDESVTFKYKGATITRKGQKEYTDFELRKQADTVAAKIFATYQIPMNPATGRQYSFDEFSDMLYERYQRQDIKLSNEYDESKATGGAKASTAPAAGAGPKSKVATPSWLQKLAQFGSSMMSAPSSGVMIPSASSVGGPVGLPGNVTPVDNSRALTPAQSLLSTKAGTRYKLI